MASPTAVRDRITEACATRRASKGGKAKRQGGGWELGGAELIIGHVS